MTMRSIFRWCPDFERAALQAPAMNILGGNIEHRQGGFTIYAPMASHLQGSTFLYIQLSALILTLHPASHRRRHCPCWLFPHPYAISISFRRSLNFHFHFAAAAIDFVVACGGHPINIKREAARNRLGS